jgi:uncharacterized protein (DUF58 family)
MLSPDEARTLDGLVVGASTAAAVASAAGLRRAKARGVGMEFHEHRPYQHGDDPRSIDWTVEARLNQLVVRVARAEGDLRVHVVVDTSRSMSLGSPHKLACATKLGAAISYVAVERRDLVGVATFDDRVLTFLPPASGRAQLFRVLNVLERTRINGASSIDRALMQFGAVVRGPGLAAIISDFFEPGAGLEGLRFLLHRGLTPAVVQVLTREETEPLIEDSVEMIDVEDGQRLVVTAAMVDAYRQRLREQAERLRLFCASNGLPWLQVDAATPFAAMVSQLERSGIFSPVV